VSYVDVGNGPVAVFVHGVFTSCHLWRNLISELADERRCVALDLPAHGHTAAADDQLDLRAQAELIEELCSALALEEVDVVANDTGGAIAQIHAARHPDRLRTLTLTNCDVPDQLPPDAFKPVVDAARAGQLAPVAQQLAGNVDLARKSTFAQCYEHPDRVPEATIREYLGPFADERRALQLERVVASLDAAELRAVEPLLADLGVPTLIAWGTGDVFFDVKWAYWLRDAIGGAREVVEIPDGKLFHPDERAAELAPHVRRHWQAAAASN
jgi:pimeloyl-ACP methyl ester carboxylesterase